MKMEDARSETWQTRSHKEIYFQFIHWLVNPQWKPFNSLNKPTKEFQFSMLHSDFVTKLPLQSTNK